jgi:hypothetical protein
VPFLRVVDQPGYWSGMVQTQPMGYNPCWNAGIGVQSVPLCHSRKLDSSVYHIYIINLTNTQVGRWDMYIYICVCVIICLFIFIFFNLLQRIPNDGEMTMNQIQFLTMAMRPSIFGEDVPTGPSGCG